VNDSKATNADATACALSSYGDIYWILGGQAKEGGVAPLTAYFDRIRHAFLIGEATDLFAGQLEGKLAYSRCGDLKSALDAAYRRARSGRARRCGRACCRRPALRGSVASYEARGDAFRRHGACLAGRAEFGEGGVIQVSARRPQRHRAMVVDRRSLVARAILAIMAFGVMLTLAASPPAAERNRRRFLPVRQAPVHFPAMRWRHAGHLAGEPAPCPAAGSTCLCWQRRAAAATFVIRHRDQRRAPLDLSARPVRACNRRNSSSRVSP